jgi:hypothetical protein
LDDASCSCFASFARETNNEQKVAKNPPSGKRQSEKGEESTKQLVRRIGKAPSKESRRKPSRSTIEESAKPENESPAEESTNSHLEA